jgi:hypothetical protein
MGIYLISLAISRTSLQEVEEKDYSGAVKKRMGKMRKIVCQICSILPPMSYCNAGERLN